MKRNSFWCVKSLLTLALSITFCILAVKDSATYGETMKTLIATVVAFYFGTQHYKFENSEKGVKND